MNLEIIRRKLASIAAEQQLRNTPAWEPLQRYLAETESTGCSYIDYWHLWRAIVTHEPRNVLELGTGASTVVIAHALQSLGKGAQVISMEESPKWYDMACRLLRPMGLSAIITLSETVEDAFGIFRGIRYKDIPARSYDFVFVDGPSYRLPSGEVTFDFDLLHVLRTAESPLRAIIDKRVSTGFVMQRVLPPGKVTYVPHLGLAFVDEVTKDDLRGIDPNTPSSSFDLGRRIDFKQ